MTRQTMMTWHYLPELPPEPGDETVEPDYLVAIGGDAHCAWYKGEGYWFDRDGCNRTDEVYAWAEWPAGAPTRTEGIG